jgi:hypothetical protein
MLAANHALGRGLSCVRRSVPPRDGVTEPGEYCRDSDQGVTGVAGDGESIICEDNDGLRWEPA